MGDKSKYQLSMRSGHMMPAVGFGTYAPKDPDDDVINAVHTAVKCGYRHLDCAAIYRNERAVGSAIKQLIVEGTVTREDLFIASKLWNTCHRPDLVRMSLKKSLDDLGLKYFDLYLMHWPVAYQEGGEFHPKDENGKVIYSDVDYLDTWKALEDCVDEGLCRNIGLSNFSSRQIQRILQEGRIKPSCNQVEIHLHHANQKLVQYCQENNVAVTAYSPLGSPGNNDEPHTRCLEEPVLLEIAKAKNKTPAQIVLRFHLQRGIGVIPKSVKTSRIQENFQLFDFELSSDEMKQLFDLNKDYRLNTEEIALQHKYYPFNDPF